MASSRHEKALQYLLGMLPQREAEEFEEQCFADDDLFEEMSALENDLIDSFVRGELSEAERQQFEKGYLISPARRANVQFSRALAGELSTAQPGKAATKSRTLPALFSLQGWPGQLAWAAMAAVVLVGVSWMMVVNRRLHHEIDLMRAQEAELQHQEQELRSQIAQLDAKMQPSDGGRQIAGPEIISLILTPGLSRSDAPAGKLVIAPAPSRVRIELYLEHDDYRGYRASVANALGPRIWESKDLQSHAGPQGGKIVTLEISSSILQSGDYLIHLDGRGAKDQFEEAADYRFQVVKR